MIVDTNAAIKGLKTTCFRFQTGLIALGNSSLWALGNPEKSWDEIFENLESGYWTNLRISRDPTRTFPSSTSFFRSQLRDKIEIVLGHLKQLGENIGQLFGRFWDNFELWYSIRTTWWLFSDYWWSLPRPCGEHVAIFKKNQQEPWLAVPPISRTPK